MLFKRNKSSVFSLNGRYTFCQNRPQMCLNEVKLFQQQEQFRFVLLEEAFIIMDVASIFFLVYSKFSSKKLCNK